MEIINHKKIVNVYILDSVEMEIFRGAVAYQWYPINTKWVDSGNT